MACQESIAPRVHTKCQMVRAKRKAGWSLLWTVKVRSQTGVIRESRVTWEMQVVTAKMYTPVLMKDLCVCEEWLEHKGSIRKFI